MFPTALVLMLAAPADLRLTGVVTNGSRPIAVLVSGERTRVVGPGEMAFGGRLVAVTPRGASIDFDGRVVVVDLQVVEPMATPRAAPAGPARAQTPRPSSTPPPDPSGSAIVMSRTEVQTRLTAEIPQLLAETQVTPLREDGRVVGLTLTRIPANSLLLDAGLHAGDVITRVNGVDIDGMATLMSLWPRLQGATELRATVLRSGQPHSVQVNLR